MKYIMVKDNILLPALLLMALSGSLAYGQKLDDFEYRGPDESVQYIVNDNIQFNGYTNYWHNTYHKWIRTGNFFKMALDNVEHVIMQSKVDIAEEMGLPGLIMSEGFFHKLTSDPYRILDQPTRTELEGIMENENVLVYVNPTSSLGKELTGVLSNRVVWPEKLKSHQYGAKDLKRVDAYILQKGDKNLFVVSSADDKSRGKFKQLLDGTENMIQNYDLHKGWFGAYTLLNSVTITPGHPLEVIGKGMNEGNSWFVFDGYMDFLSKDDLNEWINEVNLPIVTDVGHNKLFGCEDYEGLQVQRLFTTEAWFDFARRKNGYVFRNVYSRLDDDLYHYDGYIAGEGNKEQIDEENVPFILKTGKLEDNALSSMVLFLDKGESLTWENMWEAILDRREVGVLDKGKMMGPVYFRNALQMLLLDRVYLEEYFGDRINLEATVEGYELKVTVTNTYHEVISGSLEITLPEQLNAEDLSSMRFSIPARSNQTFIYKIQPEASAMGRTNPIAVHCHWKKKKKSTLAMLDLPPAISVLQVLYDHAPQITFPVSIHNFTKETSFPVQVQILDKEDDHKVIFMSEQSCTAKQGTFQDLQFELEAPPGEYNVRVTALGQSIIHNWEWEKLKGV